MTSIQHVYPSMDKIYWIASYHTKSSKISQLQLTNFLHQIKSVPITTPARLTSTDQSCNQGHSRERLNFPVNLLDD